MIFRYYIANLLSCFFCLLLTTTALGQEKYGAIKTICIDAGHGGKDPGCINNKLFEKDITLSIALKLGTLIKKNLPDIKVVYTRDKDEYIGLKERGEFARAQKANIFISIHVNAVEKKEIKGVETYVLGTHKSDENLKIAMRENAVIKYEENSVNYSGFDPSNAESYILFSLMQNSHLVNSMELANFVQNEMISQTKRVDRSVRQAPYWVLKEAAMPAILVEVGYITNTEDAQFLKSNDNQQKIAASLFNAVKAYTNYMTTHAKALTNDKSNLAEQAAATNSPQETVEKDDLFYAIQICSAGEKIKDIKLFGLEENIYEIISNGRYKYYVGKSETFETTKGKLEEIKKSIKDCFIIAIHNGKLISLAEAFEIAKK